MTNKCPYLMALVILVFSGLSAHAGDGKALPGVLCQPDADSTQFVRSSTGMYNNSTSSQYWTCPIIRDVMASGLFYVEMSVQAASSHPNDLPRCTFYSRDERTFVQDSADAVLNQRGSEPDYQWRLVTEHTMSSVQNGYYYVRCKIPQQRWVGNRWISAGIVSTFFSEDD